MVADSLNSTWDQATRTVEALKQAWIDFQPENDVERVIFIPWIADKVADLGSRMEKLMKIMEDLNQMLRIEKESIVDKPESETAAHKVVAKHDDQLTATQELVMKQIKMLRIKILTDAHDFEVLLQRIDSIAVPKEHCDKLKIIQQDIEARLQRLILESKSTTVKNNNQGHSASSEDDKTDSGR